MLLSTYFSNFKMASGALLAVTLCIITQVLLTTSSAYKCPDDSYKHDSSCYSLHFDKHFTYEDADLLCKEEDGFVSSFEDTNTREFLRRLRFKQYYSEYWIGVNKVDGKWEYLRDKVPVNFTNLLKDSSRKSDKCIAIGPNENFRWQSMSCLYRVYFICEFEGAQCGKDYLSLGDKCYKLFSKPRKFIEAKKLCSKQNGKLVEIRNEEEQKFIEEAIKMDKTWTSIPLKQLKNHDSGLLPKVWVGITYDSIEKKWKNNYDGSEYKSGKNSQFYHLQTPENENMKCASSKAWTIHQNTCNDSNSFICEYPVPPQKKLQNGNEYEIYPNKKLPYMDAYEFCERNGGSLPIVNDDLKQLKYFNTKLTESYWIKSNSVIPSNEQWGKGDKCQESYIDKSKKLKTGSCGNKFNYICEYSGESCEENNGDICYRKNDIPTTFAKAEDHCQLKGGKLVQIHNTETEDKIMDFLTRKRIPDFWVKSTMANESEEECQIATNSMLQKRKCNDFNHVICQITNQ